MNKILKNAKTLKKWLEHLDFEYEHPGYGKDTYKLLDEIIRESAKIEKNAVDNFAEDLINKIQLKYCRAGLTNQLVGMQVCDWIKDYAENIKKESNMDIEEMMIDYIMNEATQEEVEEFFGYAAYGTCTREECKNNLAQMPEEEFDMLIEKFGLPADGVKL